MEPSLDDQIDNISKLSDQGEDRVTGNEILEKIQQLVNQRDLVTSTSFDTDTFSPGNYLSLLFICQHVARWTKTNPTQVERTVQVLLKSMRNRGFTVDQSQKNFDIAMDALIKCGESMAAVALFEDIIVENPTPSIVCCSIGLNAYCKAIKGPGGLTGEQAMTRAWNLLERLKEFGLYPEQTFLSILLNIMLEANDNNSFLRALQVLEQYSYQFHEEVAMDIILRAAVRFRSPLLGFEWFIRARAMGYRPDSEAVTKLLKLCDILVVKKIKLPVEVFVTLLDAMIELNNRAGFFKVEDTFWDSNISANISIWNAIIKGCGLFRNTTPIRKILRKMEENHIAPDATTLSNVLNACIKHKDMDFALQTFRSMRQNGVEINAKHFELLLEIAVHTRDVSGFDNILCMLERSQLPRDVSLAAKIIWSNAKLGQFEGAMALYDDFLNGRDALDVEFFKEALFACKMAKQLSRAREIFAKMEEYAIHPNEMSCQILLDIMVECGVSDGECEEFILRMKERFGIQLENPDTTATTNAPQPSEVSSVQYFDDDM